MERIEDIENCIDNNIDVLKNNINTDFSVKGAGLLSEKNQEICRRFCHNAFDSYLTPLTTILLESEEKVKEIDALTEKFEPKLNEAVGKYIERVANQTGINYDKVSNTVAFCFDNVAERKKEPVKDMAVKAVKAQDKQDESNAITVEERVATA